MEIVRIYNNNVVVLYDNYGNEMIATGKGLAFQKKIGDAIDEDKIEKIFTLKDKSVMSKLQSLMQDIPLVYLTISEEIIEMIHHKSSLQLNETIFLTLTDHISMSLEREKNKVILQNPLLSEIKQFYKTEFLLALEASKIIEKHTGINISEDEAGFITFHIVNASMNQRIEDTFTATRMISQILKIVEDFCEIEFDKNSLQYDRFVRHLQFFARRILDDSHKQHEDDFLFGVVRFKYPKSYQCVMKINEYVKSSVGRSVTETEAGYLIYHIAHVTTEN